jgi:hypothetical protein
MRVVYTAKFLRQFDAAPAEVLRAFRKQISLLVENLRHRAIHPSVQKNTMRHAISGKPGLQARGASTSESRMMFTRF